jgi:hypothetical protein
MIAGAMEPAVGGPPPDAVTIGAVPAAELTGLEPPHVLEYS